MACRFTKRLCLVRGRVAMPDLILILWKKIAEAQLVHAEVRADETAAPQIPVLIDFSLLILP